MYNVGMEAKRGRPKKPPSEALIERVDLRLSTEEKQRFEAAAGRAGLGLSAWIREVLTRAAKKAGY